ncbi:MAG: PBP1A family penicillin-binding protein [Deltaproteobacteria bacterium]|jgi:penicillin-binding protein 1A|nr:PBP1A family penicillin-binding protein [Deltaproteobacteria bacterium]MBT4090558.1 PBP1A family penicillin-binding protein [Deltaproteobacteria bacterium]MBT4269304.1 PBP1A family penicillin-binding protein [Deltaproteobacteria bacterium]MBT4643258.1 PBP1A family penicillin-binding protein [Deltaproteobacteria bacterium]MBT6498543.1 PBP1A family penicillin-binding protein [Deltaproteobacteria bacterium]
MGSNPNRNPPLKKVWIVSGSIFIFAIFCFILLFLSFRSSVIREFENVQSFQSNNSIFFDIDKQPFHIIQGKEDRKYVELNSISRNLQTAVVAVEDARFFQHFGFDPIRIVSAAFRLLKKNSSLQGASTITQQLVKLTLLSPEITIKRKIKELAIAFVLETKYSKSKILEFYLNKVYLGHGNYGVENASLNFFHKPAQELTLAEGAFIAGLIKKPEGYSPFIDLKKARQRQILVLKRLTELKWISTTEYNSAVKEQILIRRRKGGDYKIAPHFTNHILLKLKAKYGHKMIYGGGLRIYTTLDRKLQDVMEKIKDKQLSKITSFKEIAGVSINPATGFVGAMVGGADFLRSEFNRVTQAKRQPGSSFKPILYATGLNKGIRPNDVYWDEPTEYTRLVDDEIEVYEPGNSSGKHLGQITVAYALKISNNVVSVQILKQIGIPALMKSAKLFGIELDDERGLCQALGCNEVTLLQLTDAYTVFANKGYRNRPVFVLKVTDREGNVLEQYEPQAEIQVLSTDIAFQMNRMLQEVVNHGTGRNAKISRLSGGKTGTSDNNRDAWYIGYTSDLVTGFWIGNDDNTPMENEFGGKTPALLWREYMQSIPTPTVQQTFAINENFEEFLLCNISGNLATSSCPSTTWYSLNKSSPPQEYCPIHNEQLLEIQICNISKKLANQYCPTHEIVSKKFVPGTEPDTFCDIHTAEKLP